jgi:hypothetical protein
VALAALISIVVRIVLYSNHTTIAKSPYILGCRKRTHDYDERLATRTALMRRSSNKARVKAAGYCFDDQAFEQARSLAPSLMESRCWAHRCCVLEAFGLLDRPELDLAAWVGTGDLAEIRLRMAESQQFFRGYDLETIAGSIESLKKRKYDANVLGGG